MPTAVPPGDTTRQSVSDSAGLAHELSAQDEAAYPLHDDIALDTVDWGSGAADKLSPEPLEGPVKPAVAGAVVEEDRKSDSESSTGTAVADEPGRRRNLCGTLSRACSVIIPRGGIVAGAFNLASCVFGAGVLSVPSAFNTTGVVLSSVYIVVFTVLTVYSVNLLVKAAEKTGIHSFEGLARGLLGRGGDIFVAIVLWLLCFGACVGFVIAVGDIFSRIFEHESVPTYLRSQAGRRCMQSAVWLFFMLPVSMPKRVNSLRYVSTIGVLLVVFLVFCVVGHSAATAFHHGIRKDLVLVRTGNNGISGISIFLFAFICQGNVFRIHEESRPRTVTRTTVTALLSCLMCATLYFLVGFFGYAEIGPTLTGNILSYYDPYKEPIFFVCLAGMIVKLVASFSQCMLTCRWALFQVLHWDVDTMPYWKHSIVAGAFAVGALILGLFVPDINIVFGLAGAFSGGFIGFVFPSIYIMYAGDWSRKSVGTLHYILTYLLLIAGVVGIVFGTTSTIYSTVLTYS